MSEAIASIPRNLARSSPYTLYVAGLLSSLITGNRTGAVFAGTAIVLGDGLNALTKGSLKLIAPNYKPFLRPDPPSEGCGIYPKCPTAPAPDSIQIEPEPQQHTFGMPSGHSQIWALSVSFWLLYIWLVLDHLTLPYKISASALIVVMALLVMVSRVYEGCHTKLQVFVGMCIGLVLGTGAFFTLRHLDWIE